MTTETPDDRTVIRPPDPSPAGDDKSWRMAKATQHNELPPGTRLGEFELLRVIGEGGFSIVYLAHDLSLDRQVAVKEYMPSSLASRDGQTHVTPKSERHRDTFEAGLKSFVNEARLLARFDHPSLVKVYRFWEAHGTAYMVMPLYRGKTLKEWLQSLHSPPDEASLLALLEPLTEALKVIHAEQCFHRDIAPDNIILLDDGGKPLLLDFGAARRVIGDMTQALTVILKPGYAPIEQYAESQSMRQGAWTDVYALAATIYFCIMGKTPRPAVSRLIEDGSYSMMDTQRGKYSDRFLSAIDRALKVRPEERTASIDVFQSEIGITHKNAAQRITDLHNSSQLAKSTQALTATGIEPSAMQNAGDSQQVDAALKIATSTSRIKVGIILSTGAVLIVLTTYFSTRSENFSPSVVVAPPSSGTAVITVPPPITPSSSSATSKIAPAAPVSRSSNFNASTEFDRLPLMQTSGYRVEATPEKGSLLIGKDHLQFGIKSNFDGFAYVLVLGQDNSITQLFPNSRATSNRIKAGQLLTLPQKNWILDTLPPAGIEKFLVIVTKTLRDYKTSGSTRESWFLKLPDGEAANRLMTQSGEKNHFLLGRAQGCDAPGCDDFAATRFDIKILAP